MLINAGGCRIMSLLDEVNALYIFLQSNRIFSKCVSLHVYTLHKIAHG